MTESHRENALLSDLLADAPAQRSTASYQPPLTRRDERRLLHEANEVGTPTLLPAESVERATEPEQESLTSELIDFVRRYPVPTLLFVGGAAYLLTRRNSR